jgi:transcriptional regulator with XRE-family HTH domain
MDSRDAEMLKEIDPSELGQRLRAARVAKGWTQTELAGPNLSVGYVSRIESGQRRPNSSVLEEMATRLNIPVDHLLRGVSAREYDEIKLTLDFAELSLESGQHLEAEAQAHQALDRSVAASQEELAYRAHYLLARALEGQGNVDDAILALEPLVAAKEGGLLRIKCAIALCRCLRDSGDFTQAVEVGERVVAQLEGTPLDGADEAVQLAVTLASAYFERGDTGKAVRTCRRAVMKAERLESPMARASAYWNASMMEASRGSTRDAVPLAERALALLAEGQDSRNVARLRSQLGLMQLRLDPPELSAAQHNLEQAAQELAWCSASAVEIARNSLALARVHYLDGGLDAASAMTGQVHDATLAEAPTLAADAMSLAGQVAAARGDVASAKLAYRQAVLILSSVGADRGAADLWFELANLLEDMGDLDAAREAYKSAAASAGLRSRPARREVSAGAALSVSAGTSLTTSV